MSTSEQPAVSVATLKAILEAFDRHDLEGVLQFFADDCVMEMPRGRDPWGQRFVGKAQVRAGLSSRLVLTGTTTAGVRLRVRGCDLWEFRAGQVTRKDSYWKIVES